MQLYQDQHIHINSVVPIIIETALQSYSLSKFSLKINAQIFNDPVVVLQKMVKHISLHTDTFSCTPLIILSLHIPLLAISRTTLVCFGFFFPFYNVFEKNHSSYKFKLCLLSSEEKPWWPEIHKNIYCIILSPLLIQLLMPKKPIWVLLPIGIPKRCHR